jgi:hypothetical protein
LEVERLFILSDKDNNASKKRLKIPKGGNQKSSIKKQPTMQWPIERGQNNKQRSTKHYNKTGVNLGDWFM